MHKKFDTKSRQNKTVCLKDEIDSFMKHLGLDEKLQDLKILDVWKQCVGSVFARHSIPVHLEKNLLQISMEDSVWRSELWLKKNEIINKLNKCLNKKDNKIIIKDIKFV